MTETAFVDRLSGVSSLLPPTTGSRIRLFRVGKGWSQVTLAEKVGISQVRISQWERDVDYPPTWAQSKLVDVLGVSRSVLFADEIRHQSGNRRKSRAKRLAA